MSPRIEYGRVYREVVTYHDGSSIGYVGYDPIDEDEAVRRIADTLADHTWRGLPEEHIHVARKCLSRALDPKAYTPNRENTDG